MKILNLMNKKKLTAQGSITVFMTFIFMIILSLILAIFENTRIISSTGYMKNASLSAEKTLFGDYNLELYKEYGLFGYGGYNGLDYDDMCQEFREIVKKNLCVKPENALLTYTDIYKIKNITVKTEKSQGFKDGDNWDRQIKACLVSDTVDEIADKIKNKHSEDGTYDEKEVYKKLDDADSYETGKYKEKYADKNEKGSEEKQGKTEIENSDKDGNKSEKNDKTEAKKDKADKKRNDMEDADIGNPLEMFKELVQNGYLSLVCDISEVSNESIEKTLVEDGYVSEEKKKVISKVIEETGYQPSSQAQMLRTKKTKLVGVILPKIDSNTISREVAGISDILTQKGYQMILANTNNSVEEELKYLSLFKDNQVDGVIFIATILTKQHREMLKEYKVPIVLLGQHLEGYPCIFQDDHKAAMSLTEQMLKTGKKFGYITVTDKDEAVGKMRISGVEEILKKNNIGLDKSCVKCGNFTLESGYEKAEELFTEHPDIDTLICATDTMAVGAVNWLKKSGYHIPDQVQVAGMGDSYLGKIIEPKLTTVHFFYKTSGMESAKMLVDLMESENISIHKEIKMGCKVVMRESHRNI